MFRIHTRRIAATLALLSTAALPQTGFAASYLDIVQKKGVKTAYTATLVDIAHEDNGLVTRTLDWRQPSIELFFDLPPSERTSEIVLNLSADPLTRVSPNTPLQVQFNDGKPVPVLSNGRGFEVRLSFEAEKSRKTRNKIRISYPTPNGADCVSPSHGAWSIDLAQSTLRMSGRAKSQNMSLYEVSNYLEEPALSPSTVGLIAKGPHGTDMQALAAQAISLRTPDVPNFSVSSKGTDFNVVMVKRSQLFEFTRDPIIMESEGARVFVPSGRPTELIFTADTDAEIIEMLEIFSTRELPSTRRPYSSLGELNMQSRLDNEAKTIIGKTRLSELAASSAAGLSNARTFKFNVDDPTATGGELLLRLSTTRNTAKDSRLRVVLNGKTLGAAKLDKKRKSVAFDIQPGDLNATANVLTLMPELHANSEFTCPKSGRNNPGFALGYSSRLELKKQVTSPVTELSHLTSSGGLFANSESYISLPQKIRDFQTSLRILGRMAKSKGQGLISADYTRKPVTQKDKHVLIIGPSDMVKGHLSGAPKALREAMSGKSSTGENLLQATYGQSASLGFDESAVQYAAQHTGARKVGYGGIAALYSGGNGKLTGVISAAPGSSFTKSSETLIKPTHWKSIKGGVSRWTPASIVMAQTAQSDARISKPKLKSSTNLTTRSLYALENLDLYLPEIIWPSFDKSRVKPVDEKQPRFKSNEDSLPIRAVTQTPKVVKQAVVKQDLVKKAVAAPKNIKRKIRKTAEVVTLNRTQTIVKTAEINPRFKPSILPSMAKRHSAPSVGLRGPMSFQIDSAPKRFGSILELRRDAQNKWASSKRWFASKTQNLSNMRSLNDVAIATDRLQDRVEPIGRTMKARFIDKLPGKALVQIGERTVSIYGLILILAFGIVLLLMSLASPSSRLGGRH